MILQEAHIAFQLTSHNSLVCAPYTLFRVAHEVLITILVMVTQHAFGNPIHCLLQ
jgi:hypothetical protein